MCSVLRPCWHMPCLLLLPRRAVWALGLQQAQDAHTSCLDWICLYRTHGFSLGYISFFLGSDSPSGPHSGRQESCQGEGPASLWVPPQARYELLQMSGGTAAFGKRKFQHPWALADIYMSFKNNILAVTVPRRKMGPGLLGGGKQPRRAREPGCSPACACLHVSIRGSGYLVELGANLRLLPRQACSSLQGGKRGMKLEILLSSEEILSRNVCTFPCFSQSTRIPKHPK